MKRILISWLGGYRLENGEMGLEVYLEYRVKINKVFINLIINYKYYKLII